VTIRWPSIPTAARASAAPAVCSSTACPTAPSPHHGVPAPHARFKDGDTITVEPAGPGVPRPQGSDVDRSAFDRIVQPAGTCRSRRLGPPTAMPFRCRRRSRIRRWDFAQCIGAGACVAACQERSGCAVTSAKVSHLGCCQVTPSGNRRVVRWSRPWTPKASAAAPRGRVRSRLPEGDQDRRIARMTRDYFKATLTRRPEGAVMGFGRLAARLRDAKGPPGSPGRPFCV